MGSGVVMEKSTKWKTPLDKTPLEKSPQENTAIKRSV